MGWSWSSYVPIFIHICLEHQHLDFLVLLNLDQPTAVSSEYIYIYIYIYIKADLKLMGGCRSCKIMFQQVKVLCNWLIDIVGECRERVHTCRDQRKNKRYLIDWWVSWVYDNNWCQRETYFFLLIYRVYYWWVEIM